MVNASRPPRRALVFSGGGARGAYEAGVVRYLVEELPKRVGHEINFDILCGTSVGAIHACYMAGTHQQGASRGLQLVDFWRRMRLEEVLPFSRRDLFGLARRALGMRRKRDEFGAGNAPDRIYGMLNTQPLERMVVRAVPWRRIRSNVNAGHVQAVCVAATEIATGRVVVFLESGDRALPGWTRDPSVVPHITHLRPTHALASAAIPVLFPVVRVGQHLLRRRRAAPQHAALAPALRLGAERVLVDRPASEHEDGARPRCQARAPPGGGLREPDLLHLRKGLECSDAPGPSRHRPRPHARR